MAEIKTYQDFLKVEEGKRKEFVRALISEHKNSDDYKTAADAYEYYCHRNVTISEYQRLLYTVTGKAIPDNWSANYKMACRHFYRFVTQEVQYLLGNGVSWNEKGTEDGLGTGTKSFDRQLQDAATMALWGKVSFGFYDKDHVEVFSFLEFAPLYDEITGALMAGVRFWQIDPTKPLRATLYELDGYTKYVWGTEDNLDEPKKGYIQIQATSVADGSEIIEEQNYPGFPIVPLWGNKEHQSEIVGLREQIDCYDLIKSGFANTVDEASIVYWTLQNAGGMTEVDLAKFVQRMKTLHAATVDGDGATAESHTVEAPYQSREALLDRLDQDLYRDAMALDVERIAGGAVTATQIEAAYEALNSKCDSFEYQVIDFIQGILKIAGIEDEPTFTRSVVINRSEMITTLLSASEYLPETYITTKVLEILGDGDKAEEILQQIAADELDRFGNINEEDIDEGVDEEIDEE